MRACRQRLQREGCSFPVTPPHDNPSRRCYAATQRQPPSVAEACPATVGEMSALLP
jgi:hypothetical protein